MRINPYLGFDGDCEEAFRFYEKVLGGKIAAMIPFSDMPSPSEPFPPELQSKLMHARLVIGDAVLMGGDAPPGMYKKPQGTNITINVDEPAEAERIFRELSEGGTVTMQIQETFWAHRFAMLTDRYGTPWMVNCEKPMQ